MDGSKIRIYVLSVFLINSISCQQAPFLNAASKFNRLDPSNQFASNLKSYDHQIDRKLPSTMSKIAKPVTLINVSDQINKSANSMNYTDSGSLHPDVGDHQTDEDCEMDQESEISAMLLESFMPNYNKQSLPMSKKSIEISIEIQINAIPHFSELDSFFELDLFFSELWHEPRLAFNHLPQSKCVKNVTLGLEYLHRLWTPNVCIVNSKAALIHSSPSENVFLILYQDGTLWKNCRMLVRGPCEIDLRLFPFDEQKCSLVFESYSYNSQKVTLRWMEESAIRFAQSVELPDFTLANYASNRSLITYPNGQWDQLMVITDNFARTRFSKESQNDATKCHAFAKGDQSSRSLADNIGSCNCTIIQYINGSTKRYGFFILQAYLPTYMTVFVAWINFWMDPKELATRATLAISAFLAMCLQLGHVQQNQPRVSYVKAMDVWMLGSISFLFLALIELAIISYMLRTDKHDHGDKKKRYVYVPASPIGTICGCCNEKKVAVAKNGNQKRKPSPLYGLHSGYSPYTCNHDGASKWLMRVGQNGDKTEELEEESNFSCGSPNGYGNQATTTPTRYIANSENFEREARQRCCSSAYAVDKFVLIIYLPAYLAFNIFYWTYYL